MSANQEIHSPISVSEHPEGLSFITKPSLRSTVPIHTLEIGSINVSHSADNDDSPSARTTLTLRSRTGSATFVDTIVMKAPVAVDVIDGELTATTIDSFNEIVRRSIARKIQRNNYNIAKIATDALDHSRQRNFGLGIAAVGLNYLAVRYGLTNVPIVTEDNLHSPLATAAGFTSLGIGAVMGTLGEKKLHELDAETESFYDQNVRLLIVQTGLLNNTVQIVPTDKGVYEI